MALFATMILAAAAFCMQQTNGSIHSLFQIHTEAQADDGGETPPITEEEEAETPENGGGGGVQWIKGYAMQQVYYTSGFQWSLTPFSFWITYSTTHCCVKHNQCTACMKSEEENVCKYLKGL